MNKILCIVSIMLATTQLNASATRWAYPSTDEAVAAVHGKRFAVPKISGDSFSAGSGTVIVANDEAVTAHINATPAFSALREKPPLEELFVDGALPALTGKTITQVAIGKGSMDSYDTRPSESRFFATMDVIDCVAVVLDAPDKCAMLHINQAMMEKESNTFTKTLVRFADQAANTRVILKSCYFTPWLERVLETLSNSGFTVSAYSIPNAYMSPDYSMVPASFFGLSMDKVNACADFKKFQKKVDESLPHNAPTSLLYNYATQRAEHVLATPSDPDQQTRNNKLKDYLESIHDQTELSMLKKIKGKILTPAQKTMISSGLTDPAAIAYFKANF